MRIRRFYVLSTDSGKETKDPCLTAQQAYDMADELRDVAGIDARAWVECWIDGRWISSPIEPQEVNK